MERTVTTAAARQPREPGRVLVTGAAGFIGSHLVDALLRAGCRVVGVDRRSPMRDPVAAVNLASAIDRLDFTFVPAELTAADLAGLADGCDTVFHLAAVPGVRDSWGARFKAYVSANIMATARLLDACERTGVTRLVYASSSSVYGVAHRASRESDPTRPISPYGVTKLAAEQLCLAHAGRPGATLTVCALRYFTVYGPRQRPDMAMGRILAAALDHAPLELYGDGTQRREFTHVSDVVSANLAAARALAPPSVVNVGGGATATMTEVIKLAEELAGETVRVLPAPAQAGDVPATEADLGVARAALRYHPTVGLHAGMASHLNWLRQLGAARRQQMYGGRAVACAS